MKRTHIISIVIIAFAFALVFVIVGGIPWQWVHITAFAPSKPAVAGNINTPSGGGGPNDSAKPKDVTPHPPAGSQTYQIAQAATQLPGFVQVTIDPNNAGVGTVQHFTVVTNDTNPVMSVTATIVTDHKTVTVPLATQGAAPVSMIVPRDFTIGSDGMLAMTNAAAGSAALVQNGSGDIQNPHVANAAEANSAEFTGQWTVEDTHAAKYETTFTATDSAGNTNSVALEWTDPCPFSLGTGYMSGTATTTGNCEVVSDYNGAISLGLSEVDGPEGGNLVVSSGTLLIDAGASLVINSGYNITLHPGGSIAITAANVSEGLSAAQILLGQDMCGTDNDGDGYLPGHAWVTASNCSSIPAVSRADLTSAVGLGDCDDFDANAHPGQTSWFSSNPDSNGSWDYNCDGTVEYLYTTATSTSPSGVCYSGSPPCNTDYQALSTLYSCGAQFYPSVCKQISPTSCTVASTTNPVSQGCY